jgi:hypothetical protein
MATKKKGGATAAKQWHPNRYENRERRLAAEVKKDPLKTRTFKITDVQHEKIIALGGAKWLRETLDATAWPRGTKPQ